MNRTITLIRHAKSDWGDPALSDFDRPLNERGEHDAPRMGEILNERDVMFDLVLASPAKRAITTARAICNAVGYAEERIEQIRDLYLASAAKIIDIVHAVDGSCKQIAVVCHNPGITSLANALGDRKIDNIPTCGIVMLETESEWKFLKPKRCKTIDFLYPKKFD